jgi:hypothetical protein
LYTVSYEKVSKEETWQTLLVETETLVNNRPYQIMSSTTNVKNATKLLVNFKMTQIFLKTFFYVSDDIDSDDIDSDDIDNDYIDNDDIDNDDIDKTFFDFFSNNFLYSLLRIIFVVSLFHFSILILIMLSIKIIFNYL